VTTRRPFAMVTGYGGGEWRGVRVRVFLSHDVDRSVFDDTSAVHHGGMWRSGGTFHRRG
jgi:hypothetical protein